MTIKNVNFSQQKLFKKCGVNERFVGLKILFIFFLQKQSDILMMAKMVVPFKDAIIKETVGHVVSVADQQYGNPLHLLVCDEDVEEPDYLF